ncbi:MAG: DUF365 domain-containing protein [Candidatus Methanosuratincola sp.]
MNEIIGSIYPIPAELADRIFQGNTRVFVKYVAHNSTRLMPKHKVIFYASHGSKKLIGEGIIEKVEFLTPQKVLEKYKDQLFLNESELHAYVARLPSRSPSKEMLTLVLKKLKKYSKPIDYNKPITMAGQYLTAEEYSSLIHKQEP